jgi:hypothetical protein
MPPKITSNQKFNRLQGWVGLTLPNKLWIAFGMVL